MKFSTRNKVISLTVSLQLIAATFAFGDNIQKNVQTKFGRYDYVRERGNSVLPGDYNPMCIALGQQLQKLKRVPMPESLKRPGKAESLNSDFRVNFPIFEGTPDFKPVKWIDADLRNRPYEYVMAPGLIADQTQIFKFRDKIDDYDTTKKQSVIDSQEVLAGTMMLAGLIKIQHAKIKLSSGKELTAYRIYIADYVNVFDPKIEHAWHVYFDTASTYDILKFTTRPIVDVFYYNQKPYVFMSSTSHLSMTPLETLADYQSTNIRYNIVSENSECTFYQKR